MKIALSFPECSRRGGVERTLYESARFLARRGHEVTVFADVFDKNGTSAGYHHVEMGRTPKVLRPLAFRKACAREMEGGGFEAHGAFGCVSPEGGVYWAQSVHAAWLDKAREFRKPLTPAWWKQHLNPTHPMLLKLEKLHFKKGGYKRMLALTDQVRIDMHQYYGVPMEDSVVTGNGYAPEEFNVERRSAMREEVRKELGFGPDMKVVVFVANELARKGLPALLRAVEGMKDDRVRILVAGRMAPAEHPLVKYVGSTNDVMRYYAAADVFALPTLYEAWGLVIVEAMGAGLPALTSRLAGASVAVKEGVTGNLLDDPRDELEISRKLRPLLDGEHATPEEISNSVREYAWDEVLKVYEDVLCAG